MAKPLQGLRNVTFMELTSSSSGCPGRWLEDGVRAYPDSPPVKGSVPCADGMAYTPDGPPTFVPFGQPSVAG